MSLAARRDRFSHLPTFEPRLDVLPAAQRAVWPLLAAIPEPFVMYGGTALALRLGHRSSLDFDFFAAEPFAPTELHARLDRLGPSTITSASPDTLAITTDGGIRLAFFGGIRLRAVAEPSFVAGNGIVVASLFDLAATKAKAILDRAEWRDYVDIGALLRQGMTLPEMIAYATAVFEPLFAFPAAVFLRSLAWFEEGTVTELPGALRKELEAAVVSASSAEIPQVLPCARTIRPW